MSTDREPLQQALEALENVNRAMPFPVARNLISAIRARLAEPERTVTLPPTPTNLQGYETAWVWRQECIAALRAAGVEVKP